MERRRILEGSALGTPIDSGQIPWNNKLYQNAKRVRSIACSFDKRAVTKQIRREIHRIEQVVKFEQLVHPPITLFTDMDLDLQRGIIKIINGNGTMGLGDDLGEVVVNGTTLPTLVSGSHINLAVRHDGSWYQI